MGRVYSRMIQNRPEHATPLVRLLDPSRIIRSARDDRRETIMRAESRTTDLARFPPTPPPPAPAANHRNLERGCARARVWVMLWGKEPEARKEARG